MNLYKKIINHILLMEINKLIDKPLRPNGWYNFSNYETPSFLDNDIHEIVVPSRLESPYRKSKDPHCDIHTELWGEVDLTDSISKQSHTMITGITSLSIGEFPDNLYKVILTSQENKILSIDKDYTLNSNIIYDFFVDKENIYLDNIYYTNFKLRFVFYDDKEDNMYSRKLPHLKIPEIKINYRLGETYNEKRTIQCYQEVYRTDEITNVWNDADYRERFQYEPVSNSPYNKFEKGRIVNLLVKYNYHWTLHYGFSS